MRPLLIALFSALLVSPAYAQQTTARDIQLEPVWRTGGFENPESALYAADTGFIYVSNVSGGGGDVDGNGFISRLTPNGEIDTLRWASDGLNAPKGLARFGNRLYVTDITDIVEIDLFSGAILARYPADGAAFLNDAIADASGRVFVSDSGTARIYVLEGGVVSIWAEGDLLRSANGLWLEPDRMLLITMSDRLVSIDRETREVRVLAEGVGSGDGIAPDGFGGYLANEWPGQVYRILPTGEVTVLADVRESGVYTNDFTIVGDIIYTPHFNSGEISAAQISPRD